jgi:uncharacterized phage-associated protein
MANTMSVAKHMYDRYASAYGELMDEMKMHKLMYFAQRESLMEYGHTLFSAKFYGWKFGPVLYDVRKEYREEYPFSDCTDDLSDEERELVDNVLDRYGSMKSWKLSALSHGELSWMQARRGLEADTNGNVQMKVKTMRVDAAREKTRRQLVNV